MGRKRIPEILLGSLLTISVFSIGFLFSSAHREPSATDTRQEQSDENPLVALWNWATYDAITVYTLLLTITTGWLGYVTLRSVNLARDEFIATHRPRIRLRSVEPMSDADLPDMDGLALTYVNLGETQATIIETAAGFTSTSDPGIIFKPDVLAKQIVLESGESRILETVSVHIPIGALLANASPYFCIGYIAYQDAAKRNRRTGFCRRYNPQNHRWVIQTESSYEYED